MAATERRVLGTAIIVAVCATLLTWSSGGTAAAQEPEPRGWVGVLSFTATFDHPAPFPFTTEFSIMTIEWRTDGRLVDPENYDPTAGFLAQHGTFTVAYDAIGEESCIPGELTRIPYNIDGSGEGTGILTVSFIAGSESEPYEITTTGGEFTQVATGGCGGVQTGTASVPAVSIPFSLGLTDHPTDTTNRHAISGNLANNFVRDGDSFGYNATWNLTHSLEEVADLEITKSVSATTASLGDQLTYTLATTNHGPNDANGAIVRDSIPAGLRVVTATGAPCELAGPELSCPLLPLAPNETQTINVVVAVDGPFGGPQVTNHARVGALTPDPDPSNNSTSVTVDVPPPCDAKFTSGEVGGRIGILPGDLYAFASSVRWCTDGTRARLRNGDTAIDAIQGLGLLFPDGPTVFSVALETVVGWEFQEKSEAPPTPTAVANDDGSFTATATSPIFELCASALDIVGVFPPLKALLKSAAFKKLDDDQARALIEKFTVKVKVPKALKNDADAYQQIVRGLLGGAIDTLLSVPFEALDDATDFCVDVWQVTLTITLLPDGNAKAVFDASQGFGGRTSIRKPFTTAQ